MKKLSPSQVFHAKRVSRRDHKNYSKELTNMYPRRNQKLSLILHKSKVR